MKKSESYHEGNYDPHMPSVIDAFGEVGGVIFIIIQILFCVGFFLGWWSD